MRIVTGPIRLSSDQQNQLDAFWRAATLANDEAIFSEVKCPTQPIPRSFSMRINNHTTAGTLQRYVIEDQNIILVSIPETESLRAWPLDLPKPSVAMFYRTGGNPWQSAGFVLRITGKPPTTLQLLALMLDSKSQH